MKNTKTTKSNTGYKGIYFRAATNKYEAQIIVARKQPREGQGPYKIHIGNYETLREAVKGREKYIKSLL